MGAHILPTMQRPLGFCDALAAKWIYRTGKELKDGYKVLKNWNQGCWLHEGFWSHHCITQQLPLAPELPTGNVAATYPVTTHLDMPWTHSDHSPVCTESRSWFVHPEWAVRNNFQSQHPAAYLRSPIPSKTNSISLPASSPGQDLAPRTACTRTADLRLQEVQGFGVLPQAAKAGSYIWRKLERIKIQFQPKILHASFSAWRD